LETDVLNLAVVMHRKPLASRWQPYQWQPLEVLVEPTLAGTASRCLRDDPADLRWLFPGFELRLYSDEAEGYFLNVDTGAPCWFVMWRLEEMDGIEVAVPRTVTLSYNEAARLMDGGEQVDTVPVPALIAERLREFVQAYYRPEPKRKRRKPSFEGGAGVAEMAKAERAGHGG
jgi:hypothetical protein